MKIIEGVRLPNGGTRVDVIEDGERRTLRHYVRHSPTGLEWGYGGSGPADLARSILIEVLGSEALCRYCEGSGMVKWVSDDDYRAATGEDTDPSELAICPDGCDHGLRSDLEYMDFKREIVAKLPRSSFILEAEIVTEWIKARA